MDTTQAFMLGMSAGMFAGSIFFWLGRMTYRHLVGPYLRRKVPAAAETRGIAAPAPTCWCHTCRPVTLYDCRMVLCPTCGNKRCPRANNHRHNCTGSNDVGQTGSAYSNEWILPGETPP